MRHDTVTHCFVAGTDTGVGKTLVSAALLHALSAHGLRAVGMKPVASGAVWVDDTSGTDHPTETNDVLAAGDAGAGTSHTGGVRHASAPTGHWHNDDVAALRRASNVAVPTGLDNPYLFEEPTAPHLAAADAGMHIDLGHILGCYQALCKQADVVVVEGVGGLLVPLDDQICTDDLAATLGLPVILVVAVRLGCINHALLTVRALAAKGLRLHSWVATLLDPQMRQLEPTLDCLRARIPAPMMGRIPYLATPDPAAAARYLDLDTETTSVS